MVETIETHCPFQTNEMHIYFAECFASRRAFGMILGSMIWSHAAGCANQNRVFVSGNPDGQQGPSVQYCLK